MYKIRLALLVAFITNALISTAQNVGIGVERPGSKLSVAGGISIGENFAEKAAPDGSILIEKSMGIGTDVIDTNVILDIRSATKGVLFPTMNTAKRNSIINPPKGLFVFNEDSSGFNFYNGSSWLNFALLGPTGPVGQIASVLGFGSTENASGYVGSSVSPVTVGAGTKIFLTQLNLAYRAGDRVRISGGGKVMEGTVQTYLAGTLTVNVDRTVGSGLGLTWNLGLAGEMGATGSTGATGATGAAGTVGAQGAQGIKGATGATGATGAQGIQGVAGANGAVGAQGVAGPAGAAGAQGPQGVKGNTGATGATGAQGIQGVAGPQGPAGAAGSNGTVGAQGPQGVKGNTGATGSTGAQGIQGIAGPQGPAGANGAVGVQGPAGPAGAAGAQGPQGVKGNTGATGATGAQGIQGVAGPQGAAGSNGTVGAQGPQGVKGNTGATGATGAAGTNGTNGAAGAQGPQGVAGPAGAVGAQGIKGATGATGAAGTNGAAGAQGPAGAAGSNGTVWHTGSGTPASGTGILNDLYLNTSNGTYYKKGASSWGSSLGTLKGATGATGPAGSLASGSAAGNTPYWNGSSWVVNSSNIFNNGANVGIGTTSPSHKFEVMNGDISIDNNNNTAGQLVLTEPSGSGTNYTAFKARAQAANITYNLPPSQAANTMLLNDGSGNLTWAPVNQQVISMFEKKNADQSSTSSSFQDDNDFTYTLEANQSYEVSGMIRISAHQDGEWKYQFVAPSGTQTLISMSYLTEYLDEMVWVTAANTTYNMLGDGADPNADVVFVNGIVTTGASGGTFKFKWAQKNSYSTATKVYANSYIRLTRVQ